MKTFYYKSLRTMEPRPGVKYSTTYIKQDSDEYDRTLKWFAQTAEEIIAATIDHPELAEWFIRPMPDFRRSEAAKFYSPQDLLMDIIDQMVHGRDLTQAMLDRWNRLCSGTPWEVEIVSMKNTKHQPPVRTQLFL